MGYIKSLRRLLQSNSNGFLVAGYGSVLGLGSRSLNLIVPKYDKNGNLIWRYCETRPDHTRPIRTIVLSNGNYGIVGFSSPSASITIISSASILWRVNLSGVHGNGSSGLEETSDGSIIAVTGRRFW